MIAMLVAPCKGAAYAIIVINTSIINQVNALSLLLKKIICYKRHNI